MATVSNLDGAIQTANTTLTGTRAQEAAQTLASFNRPADVTAYGVGDVISDSSAAAKVLSFPNCGRGGVIVSAGIVVAETDTIDFDLFLFDQEPTNFLDNAALALVAADQVKLIGVLRFLNGAKVNVGTNLELYRAVSAGTDQALPPIAYTTQDGRIFGLLVTRSAYTPISACKFAVRLGIVRNIG